MSCAKKLEVNVFVGDIGEVFVQFFDEDLFYGRQFSPTAVDQVELQADEIRQRPESQ